MNFALEGMIPLSEFNALPELPQPLEPLYPITPVKAAARKVPGFANAAVTLDAEGRVTDLTAANIIPDGYNFDRSAFVAIRGARFPKGVAGRYRLNLRIPTDHPVRLESLPPGGLAKLPKPSRTSMPFVYPGDALREEIEGDVELRLTVGAGGLVLGAGVLREAPAGYDFALFAQTIVLSWSIPDAAPGDYMATVRFRLK